MTQLRTGMIVAISTLVLAVVIVAAVLLVHLTSTSCSNITLCSNSISNNPGMIFTIVSLIAIGIERVIEGFWCIIELYLGKCWPLNLITQPLNDLVDRLNNTLDPGYDKLNAAVDNTPDLNDSQKAAAKQQIANFQGYINQLMKLPGDDNRAQLLVNTVQSGLNELQSIFQNIAEHTGDINNAVQDLQNFLATFQNSIGNNPGRRIISLYFGIILGLLVASVFDINLLALAFTPNQYNLLPPYFSYLGILLTGMVMGLGSSPTHEVIQAIQEYKQNMQSINNK